MAYEQLGEKEKAASFYEQGAARYEKEFSAGTHLETTDLRKVADSYYYIGNIEKALYFRKKVIEKASNKAKPDDFSKAAYTIMHLDYISDKQGEQMVEWCEKALSLFNHTLQESFHPDMQQYLWKGYAHYIKGDFINAQHCFSKYLLETTDSKTTKMYEKALSTEALCKKKIKQENEHKLLKIRG